MTKDEGIRIDETINEFMRIVAEGNARRANLASECASLRAQLTDAQAELAKLKPPVELKAVE